MVITMRFIIFSILVFLSGCEKTVTAKYEDIVYLFCANKEFEPSNFKVIHYNHPAFSIIPNLNLIHDVDFYSKSDKRSENYVEGTEFWYRWRTTSDTNIEKNGFVIVNNFKKLQSYSLGNEDIFRWKRSNHTYELNRMSLELSREVNYDSGLQIESKYDCKKFDNQIEFEEYSSNKLAIISEQTLKREEKLRNKRKI